MFGITNTLNILNGIFKIIQTAALPVKTGRLSFCRIAADDASAVCFGCIAWKFVAEISCGHGMIYDQSDGKCDFIAFHRCFHEDLLQLHVLGPGLV